MLDAENVRIATITKKTDDSLRMKQEFNQYSTGNEVKYDMFQNGGRMGWRSHSKGAELVWVWNCGVSADQ